MSDPQGVGPWLIYGAYGYTGRLVVARALERGLRPVLAGRDADATRQLAASAGLAWRAFPLDDGEALRQGIRDMKLVLNVAGPFSVTWRPMLDACLDERCSYLDITGEIDVLEAMQELDARARTMGVHVVPAVGFDVVPTDCAATLAAGLLEGATHLDLAFHVSGGPSRGTMLTAIERLGRGGAVRRLGRIEPVAIGSVRKTIYFSDRPRGGVAIPWGDVSTAYRSTGIPNIRVFAALPGGLPNLGRLFGVALEIPSFRALATWATHRLVEGPSTKELDEGHARVRAEVRDVEERSAAVELVTPNAYALTATAAVAAVERMSSGQIELGPGVHTPSNAFGTSFATALPGVELTEETTP